MASEALRLAGKIQAADLFVLLPGDEEEAAFIGSEAMRLPALSPYRSTPPMSLRCTASPSNHWHARVETDQHALIVSTRTSWRTKKPRRVQKIH